MGVAGKKMGLHSHATPFFCLRLLDLRQLGVVATGRTALALDSFEYDDTRLGLLIGTVQVEQAVVGTGVVTNFDPLDLSGFHFFLFDPGSAHSSSSCIDH